MSVMKPESVQTIAAIAMAFATILLVLVTGWYARKMHEMVELERERDREQRERRPKLDMTASTRPPDCFLDKVYTEDGRGHHDNPNREPLRDWAGCCWLRALVRNTGNVSAESVEIYITELRRCDNGSYVPARSFAPRRLIWANTLSTSNPRGEAVLPSIHPEISRYCDIGHIVEPKMERRRFFRDRSYEKTFEDKPVLELCVDSDGPPYDHALAPGRYQLGLMLSCADRDPEPKTLELHFAGAWPKDQSELWRLVTVEILNDTPT